MSSPLSADWRNRLFHYLAVPKIVYTKLKAEERISYEVNCAMTQLVLDGTYRGVCMHVPNEGQRSMATKIILKAIGVRFGASDWVFVWRNPGGHLGGGFVELKVPAGITAGGKKRKQSELKHNQAEFAF